MRIKEIGIENFGLFNERSFNLAPEMNIILGENEAGKSTLLAFIRWVLFGFAKGERLAPFSGGDPGGYLLLQLEDGKECAIRRTGRTLKGEVTIRVEDENLKGTEAEFFLEKLLGAITDNVYKNVFAFGLGELQTINTLEDNEVSSFLYSKGLYPGNLPLSEIEKELDKLSGGLYSESKIAKRPLINSDLIEYEKLENQLEDFSKDPVVYNECLKKIENAIADLKTHSKKLKELEEKRDWLMVLKKAWPLWEKRGENQNLIDTIVVEDSFPGESLAELETLKKDLDEHQEELLELEISIRTNRDLLEGITIDKAIVENEAEIEALNSELTRYTDWKIAYEQIDHKIKSLTDHLEKQIKQHLGNQYSLEGLEESELSYSYELNQTIRDFQEQFSDQDLAVKQEERIYKDLVSNMEATKTKQKTIQTKLTEIPVIENFPEIEEAYDAYKSSASSKEFFEKQLQDLGNPEAKPERSNVSVMLILVSLLSIAMLFSLGFRSWIFAGTFGILAISLAAVFLKQRRMYGDSLKLWEKKEQKRLDNLKILEKEITAIQERLRFAKQILDTKETSSEDDPKETLRKEIAKAKDNWGLAVSLQRELNDLDDEIKALGAEVKAKELELEELKKQGKASYDAWIRFLEENSLPFFEPLSLLEWLGAYGRINDQIHDLSESKKQKELIRENRAAFRGRTEKLAKTLGREIADIEVDVISWKKAFAKNKELIFESKRLDSVINDLLIKEKVLKGKIEIKTLRFEEILKEGQVETIEQFRVHSKRKTEKTKLARDIVIQDTSLRALVTPEKEDQLYRDLELSSEPGLDGKLDEVEEGILKAREGEKELNKHLGGLREKLNQLKAGKEVERLINVKSEVTKRLNSNARKWIEATLCKYLIERARATYEKEKQPGVLKTASVYFERVTMGRYIKVMSPLMEQRFEVLGADQVIKKPEELSRGTLEQLLLCLRLGLISEFAKHQRPLPMVIDDILANFDPHRSVNTLKILCDLESMHQVLFFTCQPHLIDLCKNNDIEYKLIELSQ